MFKTNAFQLYKELNGTGKVDYISPDPDKATKFWNDIWSVSRAHNQDARWLWRVRQKLTNVEKQGNIEITVESIQKRVSGMSNWKAQDQMPYKGSGLRSWQLCTTEWQNTHKACLNTGIVPPWVTKGRTLLIMRDIKKGGVPSSYRPIACLTIMWKFMTGIIGDEI